MSFTCEIKLLDLELQPELANNLRRNENGKMELIGAGIQEKEMNRNGTDNKRNPKELSNLNS